MKFAFRLLPIHPFITSCLSCYSWWPSQRNYLHKRNL